MKQDIFKRIASRFYDEDIDVIKIIWLDNFNANRQALFNYIEDDVLNSDKKLLIQCFRNKIYSRISSYYDTYNKIEELIDIGGWLVEIEYRPPDEDDKITFDENKKPSSWKLAPFVYLRHYYGRTLQEALCRALLWTAREERRIFLRNWERRQAERKIGGTIK